MSFSPSFPRRRKGGKRQDCRRWRSPEDIADINNLEQFSFASRGIMELDNAQFVLS